MTASTRYDFRGTIAGKMVRGIVPAIRRPHRVMHEHMKIPAIFLFKAPCGKIAVHTDLRGYLCKICRNISVTEIAYLSYQNIFATYFFLDKHFTGYNFYFCVLTSLLRLLLIRQKYFLHIRACRKFLRHTYNSREWIMLPLTYQRWLLDPYVRKTWAPRNFIYPVFFIALLIHLRSR